MAFEKICTLDDIWEGDMQSFDTGAGVSVLLVYPLEGELRAYQSICPHQEIALVNGTLEDNVLTCSAHLWKFDANTGKGINPGRCELAVYPLRVEGDDVLVDVAGVEPKTSSV